MTEKEQMLTSILNCRRVDLYVDESKLTLAQKCQYEEMQRRRNSGEPLQYVIGSCEFMGIDLKVDNRVLIPRPETEILVDIALQKLKSINNQTINILDLGTGSGSISIALAKNCLNCLVTSVDVSKEALELAEFNAKFNNVSDKITFVCKDMVEFLKDKKFHKSKYDLIISNPPYIQTSQLNSLPLDVQLEPKVALDGGSDGLYFYRNIIENSHVLLKDKGFLMFEIGDDQYIPIKNIFKQYSFYIDFEFFEDYVGTKRVVFVKNDKCQMVNDKC